MARRKISTTVYITPEQDESLKALSGRTKVPVAEYVREGIALILAEHRDLLEAQAELPHVTPRAPRAPASGTETAQRSLFDSPAPPRRR
jgi:predicted DNA-binding protein